MRELIYLGNEIYFTIVAFLCILISRKCILLHRIILIYLLNFIHVSDLMNYFFTIVI